MYLLSLLFIYFVQFTDKQGSEPIEFSERAQAQRELWNIKTDSLDYEVSPVYLDSIRQLGATVMHCSRWMNGATVKVVESESESVIEKIKACSFVDTVYLTRDDAKEKVADKWDLSEIPWKAPQRQIMQYSDTQLNVYNLLALHERGYIGQGIQMAVIDGGFTNANTLTCFDSVRSRILGIYDFTDDTDDFYGPTGGHGSMCFSLIGGYTEGYEGSAMGAEYYLMRSEEYATESPKEMDNLVVAFEKADSLGINVLSISLGYALFDNPELNLTYAQMDGRSTRVSRAATIAAKKGILVCNAAGNEGNKEWKYITSPADADSILTVGAVGVDSAMATFSSFGPSADGRVKPEVCAVGRQSVIINPETDVLRKGNGTSFACPLLAGLAACVWSAHPQETAAQIRQRIIDSAHKKDTPDERYGYGIPDALKAAGNPAPTKLRVERLELRERKVVLENGQVVIECQGEKYSVLGLKIENKKG